MSSIAVITDSACDLSDELAAANNVEIVPLTIRFGETELVDRRDLTTQEFWDRSASSPVLPQTAAPAPGEFESAFNRAADAGAGSDTRTKPEVTVPDGPPPTKLEIKDLIKGTGAEAVAGKSVTVQYVGVSYSTKKQFDASWDSGRPFPFELGSGQVIQGWDQGVVGMKVGGRRQLIIPPDLGYGDRGAGGDIKPGETLVFVIDLLSVG